MLLGLLLLRPCCCASVCMYVCMSVCLQLALTQLTTHCCADQVLQHAQCTRPWCSELFVAQSVRRTLPLYDVQQANDWLLRGQQLAEVLQAQVQLYLT